MGSHDDAPKDQSAGALALAIIKRHVFKQTKDGPVVDQGIVDDIAEALAAERATVERLEQELGEFRALTVVDGGQSITKPSDVQAALDYLQGEWDGAEQRLADAEAALAAYTADERTRWEEYRTAFEERIMESTGNELDHAEEKMAKLKERAEQAEAQRDLVRRTLLGDLRDRTQERDAANAKLETVRAEVVEECAKVAARYDEWIAMAIRTALSPAPREEEGTP